MARWNEGGKKSGPNFENFVNFTEFTFTDFTEFTFTDFTYGITYGIY